MVPNHQIGFVAIFLIELTTNRSKPKARLKIFLGRTCRKEATCVPTFSFTVSNWFTGRLLSSLPFFSFLSSFCLRFVPFLLRFALCAKLSTFDIENSTVERDRCFLSKLLLFYQNFAFSVVYGLLMKVCRQYGIRDRCYFRRYQIYGWYNGYSYQNSE